MFSGHFFNMEETFTLLIILTINEKRCLYPYIVRNAINKSFFEIKQFRINISVNSLFAIYKYI